MIAIARISWMPNIPTVKLNNGFKIPGFGFGTWQLSEGDEVIGAVTAALKAGYRLIDTAKIYQNEEGVGEAVKRSGVDRSEIFITTKLWSSDLGYESGLKAFERSLQNLKVDHIELYLIHWPNGDSRHEAWRALQELYESGKAKSIGVSNYEIQHLEELISGAKIIPAVNQIPFHPFVYAKQEKLVVFCKAHGITVEAYSPLAQAERLNHPTVSKIAAAHHKSSAQIMLRWAIQHDTIPIPRSRNPERIVQNLDIFDFELTDRQMNTLNTLGAG